MVKIRRLLIAIALVCSSLTVMVVVGQPAAAYTNPNPQVLGYPWSNAAYVDAGSDWGYSSCPSNDSGCMSPFNQMVGSVNYGESDPWAYYLRNCTSYVAWKLTNLGVPSAKVRGLGNGGNWYDNAPNNGLSRGTAPQVGAAAVEQGSVGHVAYVEAVNSDGTMTVSEYNEYEDGQGDTRTGTPASLRLTEFVYFAGYMSSGGSTQVSTSSLSNGEVSVPYSQALSATGDTSPYSWSVISGSLPDGLSLSSGGTITGTPTTIGSSNFIVRATGTNGQSASASLSVTISGTPQAFYYDGTTGSVRHSWWTGSVWQFETLDGSGSGLAGHTGDAVGSTISAVVVGGNAQVFYYDAAAYSLRHAWWTGSVWQFETLDGAAASTAGHINDHVGSTISAIVSSGNSQVLYYDATAGTLRHAWWTGSAWQFEVLDGPGSALPGDTGDVVGTSISAMGGTTQVFYSDVTTSSVRHAWWTGSVWQFETLDGAGSSLAGHTGDAVGSALSAVLVNGTYQLLYYDSTTSALRHAWWTGAVWQFETVDGSGSALTGHVTDGVGSSVSSLGGNTQAFYYDATTASLRHAWWTGSVWQFETLDGPGSSGPGRTADAVGSTVAVLIT